MIDETQSENLHKLLNMDLLHAMDVERRAQGLSLTEWANRASMAKNALSRIRNGQIGLTLYTLTKLALALGLTPKLSLEPNDVDPEWMTTKQADELTAVPVPHSVTEQPTDEEPSYEHEIQSPSTEAAGTPKEIEAPGGAKAGQESSTVEGSPGRVRKDVPPAYPDSASIRHLWRNTGQSEPRTEPDGLRIAKSNERLLKPKVKSTHASFSDSDLASSVEQFLKERNQ